MRTALLTFFSATLVQAAVHLYPAPEGVTPAPDFEVRVNGKQAFVYDSPVGPFLHFSMSGPIEVNVKVRSGVRYGAAQEYEAWGRRYKPAPIALPLGAITIRPLSARVVPVVSGDTIRFQVPHPLRGRMPALPLKVGGSEVDLTLH